MVRRNFTGKCLILLSYMLMIVLVHAYAGEVLIDDFSSFPSGHWPEKGQEGEKWGIFSQSFFHTDQYNVRAEKDNKYLEAYVDEQAFRYSWRKESDWTRFDRLMHRVLGPRLPYSELTGGKKR